MAKSTNGQEPPASNGPEPLTEEGYLTFSQMLDDAELVLASALAACKGPRREIKAIRKEIGARMNLEAFDRARRDWLKPGHERATEDAEYRRNMAWRGRPLGTQASLDLVVKQPGVAELHAIDGEGYEAGKAGHPMESVNSWTPGDERYARFATAHKRGFDEFMAEQAARAEQLRPDPDAPKRRGRPPGSRNRAREATA